MIILQITPFLLVAMLAVAAVLSHVFDDNLLQRVGLSAICIGATLSAWVMLRGGESNNPFVLLAYGLAIYGVGTTQKVWRFKCNP